MRGGAPNIESLGHHECKQRRATLVQLGSKDTGQDNGKAAATEPEVEVEAKAGPSKEDTGPDNAKGSEKGPSTEDTGQDTSEAKSGPSTEDTGQDTSEAKAGPSNEETEPNTAEGSERKERKTRNVWAVPFFKVSEKNKLLVAAVMELNPFLAPFGKVRAAWESVAAALNKEVVFQASRSEHSGCQNQIKKLLDYWKRRRSVAAELHNKLDSWERTLEQLLNFKLESEHKKTLKKAPVSTPEEEMLLSSRNVNLNPKKRPRLELKEDRLEAVVDEEVIPHVMKVLMGHSKQLQRVEGLMVDLFSLQNSLLETLKRDENAAFQADAE